MAQSISAFLHEQRPVLVTTNQPQEAIELLLVETFDLLILDLDQLGGTAVTILKSCPPMTVSLVLGSKALKDEILRTIKAGASDFALKPLDGSLFKARVGMALAKISDSPRERITFGDLLFDVTGGGVELNGTRLALTPTENALLLTLMRRAGAPVTKDFLSQSICQDDDWVSHTAIEVYIHRLRRKMQDSIVKIETRRGLGYALQLSPKN
ncbi:MAG: response regulator transcription factor [Alphaproteobacteria bacterium]|nr:response regulator transcription factor [Alphaproteobacteria bacterium]